mmetsp:Transcript_4342/g.11231  ORF Transcript_4342/g.11231 Transcript_4342/m.11231 type:complete len:371 (-) Transcript_4342:119-1231(-)
MKFAGVPFALVLASALLLCAYADNHENATDASGVSFCTRSDQEQTECETLINDIFPTLDTTLSNFQCVQGDGDIMSMLEAGKCNAVTDLDAHELFDGAKDHGLEPVVAEDYTGDGEGLSYYAIAVVPKDTCKDGTQLSDLKGLKSCHTGYKKTSGWTIPLAVVLSTETGDGEPDPDTSDVSVMTGFFPQLCAPGFEGDNATANEMMCANCAGDCSKDSDKEPYVGYDGSYRCLMEKSGDVAFMKHSTPLDYSTDGTDPQDWASMSTDDISLVCPEGGCAAPSDYKDCNFAKVPSHVVAATKDVSTDDLQSLFLEAAKNDKFKSMFLDGDNPSSMFKKGTVDLVPVKETVEDYLGKLNKIYSILESSGYYS